MEIIDSHLHLPIRSTLHSFDSKKVDLLSELRKNSVKQGIVIPDNQESSTIGDMKECINLFSEVPNIYLLGTVDILEDNLGEKKVDLETYFKSKQIVGLKIFPGHDNHYPDDDRLEPFWQLCIKYNKPFVIHTGENSGDSDCSKYNDPKYIVNVCNKYPDLKIIISHLFWPKVEYCVEITKDSPNISYDTSALADEEVVLKTGVNNIKFCLEELINKYNKKVLFGSDYGMCSIEGHIQLINSLDISEDKRERVFSKNAASLFGL